MERHDVGVHPAARVPGARDARVLGGHAQAAAARVVALGLARAPCRLGLDERAGTVTQVHELEQVEVGLDERVASADAAVGPATAHKGRGIARAHDDELDLADVFGTHARVAAAHDEVAARVAELRGVDARGREDLERVGLERALGNGDAQRALGRDAHGVVAVGDGLGRRARGLEALEREGKARRRDLVLARERTGKDRVVAAARAHRVGQVAGIGLEHEARVVVERVHDGEVERERARVVCRKAGDEFAKLRSHGAGNARRGEQLVHAVEHLDAARQARELADGALDRRALGALGHAGVEPHKIVGVHKGERIGGEFAVAAALEEFLERAHAAADDLDLGQLERADRLEHERHELHVGRGTALADQLKAELRELARAAGAALALAHDRGLVAQAQRQVGRLHARGHQANDRERVVGPHHEQTPVVVKELERRVGNAAALLERALVFQKRRLDGQVMVLPQAALHRQRDLLARLSLLGQDVAESPRCGRHLGYAPLRSCTFACVLDRSTDPTVGRLRIL